MPENYDWVTYKPLFYYKPQAYEYSCFSACLQMALVNFGLIPQTKYGRITEDEFNDFMIGLSLPNLDAKAPDIDLIDNFLLLKGYTGGKYLSINLVNSMTEEDFLDIQHQIDYRGQIAIIGSIKGQAGHALALIKCKGVCYGIDPSRFGIHCMSGVNIVLVEFQGNQAIRIQRSDTDFLGAIDHCWIIHPGV